MTVRDWGLMISVRRGDGLNRVGGRRGRTGDCHRREVFQVQCDSFSA